MFFHLPLDLSEGVFNAQAHIRAGHTDREVVQHAVHQIASTGGHLVGAVLNDPSEITLRYGSPYYYGSYYGTYYAE